MLQNGSKQNSIPLLSAYEQQLTHVFASDTIAGLKE